MDNNFQQNCNKKSNHLLDFLKTLLRTLDMQWIHDYQLFFFLIFGFTR
jgi:hypothetical protein